MMMKLTPVDIDLLIASVMGGAAHPNVGYEDPDRSMAELIADLRRPGGIVPIESVESALWSANLLDEVGMFKHPQGLSFDEWADGLAPEHQFFDRFYNFFRDNE